MFRSILFVLCFVFSALDAKEPVMLLKGKLLAGETFDTERLEVWETSGDVGVVEGQLQWASVKGGAKAGISAAMLKPDGVTLESHILEYTFSYHDELYRNQIVYNDEYGHAIIIELRPEYHYVRKWPDQELLHRFEEFPDAAGSSLKPGQSYTVMIEMSGPEFLVHADDENFLFGENYRVARAKHRLVVGFEGGEGTLDSVRLWEATPHPDWEKNRSAWIAKQKNRPSRDSEGLSEFEVKIRVAELRRQRREMDDPEYAEIVNETAAHLEEIRSQYPFYRAKPTRQNLAAQKAARLNDKNYQSMMKQLALLEKQELAYFQTLDPALLEVVKSPKKP
jgi:hypothetical protein